MRRTRITTVSFDYIFHQGLIRQPFELRLNMIRHGVLLIAVAIAGFCAMVIYNASMERVWAPLYSSLPVEANRFTTRAFDLEPGYNYGITISVEPAHALPHADCLLGAGDSKLYPECKGHRSALDLAWVIRDDLGSVVSSGVWPPQDNVGPFGDSGNYHEATIAYISVHRQTKATLEFRFRRDASSLARLNPHVAIFDPDASESASIGEVLIGLLLVAVGGLGVIILGSFIISRYLPIRPRSGTA